MGFTTPAFIRRNTPELRKKLDELGYEPSRVILDGEKLCLATAVNNEYAKYTSITNEMFDSTNPHETWNCAGRIDCGTNENLFLAIAALRDDTDKFQWFTDSYHWEICPDEVAYINAWIDKYESSPHKATVEELIEHFKVKNNKKNRTIKFRGKSVFNDEWIYGDLALRINSPKIIFPVQINGIGIKEDTIG